MSRYIYDMFCLMCCPPWPPKIAEKIAFQPPPPSYCFGYVSDKYQMVPLESQAAGAYEMLSPSVDCLYATSSRGNRIACIFVRCTNDPSRHTVLFSHGNAADLGHMCLFYSDLGKMINCNIFSYDYSGYGASGGKPSEKNLYADIECAWQTMQSHCSVPPERVIVFGASLGSVPSVDLASKHQVGAVVLQSPICSAIRTLRPNTKHTWCWDSFASIDKVQTISAPVLVIHGTDDEIVPFSHGVTTYERCQCRVPPLWLEGAGHNDIEGSDQYSDRLKLFVNIEIEQYTKAMIASRNDPEPRYMSIKVSDSRNSEGKKSSFSAGKGNRRSDRTSDAAESTFAETINYI